MSGDTANCRATISHTSSMYTSATYLKSYERVLSCCQLLLHRHTAMELFQWHHIFLPHDHVLLPKPQSTFLINRSMLLQKYLTVAARGRRSSGLCLGPVTSLLSDHTIGDKCLLILHTTHTASRVDSTLVTIVVPPNNIDNPYTRVNMSQWPSLLAGYEGAEPLPTTINPDGKSLYNPPGPRSASYDEFPKQFNPSKNGFDFHIYYMPAVAAQAQYAKELHERVRREFPEVHKFFLLHHPVNTFSPHQTGALFSWLVVNRGPCDILVHPNTGDALRDHTELATWIGKTWPLYEESLRPTPS
ncbi:DOPA-like domain-containing protein [Suillus fuscotomentosus]|uniref:DOPA-like domain-containing protein n=1 Tax=Suillus fuscotomentosus TaxID=1912939 RepID=A0AAD4DS57_9AGAM|nr:DOPA-like domain-containing protein [Suillus fuscotomentosus]KAG1891916.1 DOPA-like domain-containing protein [Suillus fuscotomentosus]